jgi:hypothetical protein
VAFTVSPSSVLIVSVPMADAVASVVSAVPLLVILIVSVVFGRVNVPFAENVERMCVWFIGVTPVVEARSCKTGCGDNSIPDDDVVLVVVVLLVVVVVVVAATGVVAMLVDAPTIIAIASRKIVVAAAMRWWRLLLLLLLLFFSFLLSRCIMSFPSGNTKAKCIRLIDS